MKREMKKTRVRTATLCVSEGKLLCVELRDPTTRKRFWSIPGGAIEKGESAIVASEREVLEETGYRVRSLPESEQVTQYPFRWDGRIIQCETHWFRGELLDDRPAPVDDADFLLGCAWLPVDRIARLLSPHPEIRDTVLRILGIGGPPA